MKFGLVGLARVRAVHTTNQYFEFGRLTPDCGQSVEIWVQIRILREISRHIGFFAVEFGHFGARCTLRLVLVGPLPATPIRYRTWQKYQRPELGAQISQMTLQNPTQPQILRRFRIWCQIFMGYPQCRVTGRNSKNELGLVTH